MNLLEGSPGSVYRVDGLNLPLELARRLEALGLFPGSQVTILRKKRRGAMIITVRGTRFALGMDIAEHIAVRGESYAS
ncbi:ferrous iron transport protein A [Acutalibacter sp. 1XD8-33]|uniref:FeoA family protein n=1 Tax=Acutalibacter sp. 1XD8-33 TaxID=2320081 RepID=UPI000EA25B43|nr:FeoA family protein [Acutalibacter sp. 1XD8-33]RKJ41748.1 ferrous iron transport protein A [Acutalibacter sp. 1XD8-33]